MTPEPPSMIALEIGVKDHLSDTNARLAATAFQLARQHYPDSPLMFMIGGYDDDPRELWEIPETRRYIRAWAVFCGIADWREALQVNWFENHGLGLLQACGVFAADSPIHVTTATRN